MKTLIRNGKIVLENSVIESDLLIENNKIISIDPYKGELSGLRLIDANKKIIFPGGIDPHVHFDIPLGSTFSSDDFASGTRAAAIGGTTTIIDFANQSRGHSVFEALEKWQKKAEGKAYIDYSFHISITDLDGTTLQDMEKLFSAGLTSFKLFTAYPGVCYLNDGELFLTMQKIAALGGIALIHAENGLVIEELIKRAKRQKYLTPNWHAKTRPALLEAEATARALAIAYTAGCPAYIVHLTNGYSLEEVKRAGKRSPHVYAETCPQYLLLDDSLYTEDFESAKWVLSPPLRSPEHKELLWQGLQNKTLDTVATDHCPFYFKGQKDLGKDDFTKIPNGIPGVENRFSLIYTEAVVKRNFSLNDFSKLISTNAAKLFGLYPQKGVIAPGADADIVIFNPASKEKVSVNNKATHNMNVDYNAFEGFVLQGMVESVLSRGSLIVEKGVFKAEKDRGQFLKRKGYKSTE